IVGQVDPKFPVAYALSIALRRCSLRQRNRSSMHFGLVNSLIAIFGGAVALWAITRAVRYQSKVFRSRNWPIVPGAVQKAEVLQRGATSLLRVPFRSLLGYSYEVDGRPYWVFLLWSQRTSTRPRSCRCKLKACEFALDTTRKLLRSLCWRT